MQDSVLPDLFIQRLTQMVPNAQSEKIMCSFAYPRIDSFRINTIKAPVKQTTEELLSLGYEIEPLTWYPDAFYLRNKSLRELTETGLYKNGCIYIQNVSSMIPVLLLDPQPGEKVLDIAAAPGSKTTQIAVHMGNSGEIVANDVSRERMFKLRENLKTQGVTNTTVTLFPGEHIWQKYPEYFDRTLVDVPCSMEGRIHTSDPKSYADWSLKRIKSLAVRQQYLLRGAVTATKPGGIIVYSTCTLAPEENEGVINWLLEKEGEKIEIEEVSLPNLTLSAGLPNWIKPFDSRATKTARIWPSETMEGFFVSKIRKLASTLPLPPLQKTRNPRRHR